MAGRSSWIACGNRLAAGTDGRAGPPHLATFAGQRKRSLASLAAGAIEDGRLYMIFFQGTRIYHFGKDRDEAEHIIATARLN
jgi:hypothetical protein